MNRLEKAAAFGAMMGKMAFYKRAGNPTLDFYKKQQEQEIASARAQAAALRGAAGVTGSGGGTATGRVFPDGKGGYRTEGAQFTPQAGYDQKGFKIQPSGAQGQKPLPSVGGKQKMPPAPMGQQPVPKAMPTNKTIPNRRVILDN